MDRERSVIEEAHFHIFGFNHRKDSQFQKKLLQQNLNIYEYGPPQLPIFRGPWSSIIQFLSTMSFGVVTPDCRLIQAQYCCIQHFSILSNNLEQLTIFGYIVMLRVRMFRSLIIRTGIKERNIRARNITI